VNTKGKGQEVGSKSYAYALAASAGLARRTNTLSKEVTSFDLGDLMDCIALASFTRTYIPSFDTDCLIAEPLEKMPSRVNSCGPEQGED
jgi:hypothetical protein